MSDWDFTNLAHLWEYRNGAIMTGADALEAMPEAQRERSLVELADRTTTLARGLDDGWLVMTAIWMVDDIYKSFFRFTGISQEKMEYLAATAAQVVDELQRRGFALHYVVDATQGEHNLQVMLAYLPAVFQASGFSVVGPQLAAREVLRKSTGHDDIDGIDVTEIQSCRDEGHLIADEVIAQWHTERRSSAYLNLDLDDDSPALSVDVALSVRQQPGAIVVFRDQPPAEGSEVKITPPPGVTLPVVRQ